jgi:hypothetical protein
MSSKHYVAQTLCSSCGGERVAIKMKAGPDDVRIARADAGLFHTYMGVEGFACAQCGLLTIYAKDPTALRKK